MKILFIVAISESVLLILASITTGKNIMPLISNFDLILAENLGALVLVYPATCILFLFNKIRVRFWHFLGIIFAGLYSTLSMILLPVVTGDISYMTDGKIKYIIYFLSSLFVIIILYMKHGHIKKTE